MEKCILVYEDDLEILQLCKTILSTSGYKVEAMSNCENIISDVARIKPNLILMDLWIPQIGGEQAITLLRESSDNNEMPVVIFSAHEDIEAISKRINATSFIKKPFDISTLKGVISDHVS